MEQMKSCIQRLAAAELRRANELHPPFASTHEGWAVLLEEIRELSSETQSIVSMHELAFEDVMRDQSPDEAIECVYDAAIRAACEAVQVAAMAQKFIEIEDNIKHRKTKY